MRWFALVLAVLIVAGVAHTAFGCSGPGAGFAIKQNTIYAQMHAAFVGALTAGSIVGAFKRSHWGFVIALAFFLLIHPAWTMSALRGDCGYGKVGTSVLLSFLAAAVYAGHLVSPWWDRYRRRLRSKHTTCPECDYDLRGRPDGGCPECGWNRIGTS